MAALGGEMSDKSTGIDSLEMENDPKKMTDLKTALGKLNNLAADDKSEMAMLRSRIDEQSQLIMILKKRADDASLTVRTLNTANKELEQYRQDAQDELRLEIKKYKILDARFNDLAENHEELIKIKDDYKRRNETLVRENKQLREENTKQFNQGILDRDNKIEALNSQIRSIQMQYGELEQENKILEKRLKESEENSKLSSNQLSAELKKTKQELDALKSKLEKSMVSSETHNNQMLSQVQKLTKENAELLELSMSRGKLIQEKQEGNKRLQLKLEDQAKALKAMEEKFEREMLAVNSNAAIKKLREQLTEAELGRKELSNQYEAYKKHTSSLLSQEREINAKLRMLSD